MMCSAVIVENDECSASVISGAIIPMNGNKAKKRNSVNSFIGWGICLELEYNKCIIIFHLMQIKIRYY